MALSDEDREAIAHTRMLVASVPRETKDALERVLRLAGELPEEPADGTFWFDPEENDVWMRDDTAAGPGDLYRWWTTGSDGNFLWSYVHEVTSGRLVGLVRRDTLPGGAHVILHELHGAWQAWHRNACGNANPLSKCPYHECVQRWAALLEYGFRKKWE